TSFCAATSQTLSRSISGMRCGATWPAKNCPSKATGTWCDRFPAGSGWIKSSAATFRWCARPPRPVLLRLDLRVGDDLFPFLGFKRLEFSQFIRRACFRLDARGEQLFRHVLVLESFTESRVQLVDDRLRSFRRCVGGKPRRQFVSLQSGFVDRRKVWRQRRTLDSRHGIALQLADTHGRQRR